ncbi:MAG: ammonium transporter [Firmicutes bacterium]|nr:ammonium transporter [Bacillota bacterium]
MLVFVLIKALFGIRVSRQEEEEGLDWHEHGAIAYPENGLELVNSLFSSEDFHLSEAVRQRLQGLNPSTARSLREIAQSILATQESASEKS